MSGGRKNAAKAEKPGQKASKKFDDNPFIWYMDIPIQGWSNDTKRPRRLDVGRMRVAPHGDDRIPHDSWFNRTLDLFGHPTWRLGTTPTTKSDNCWSSAGDNLRRPGLRSERAVGATFAPGGEGYILFAEPNDHNPPPLPP